MNLEIAGPFSRRSGRELTAFLLAFAAFAALACGSSKNAASSLDGGGGAPDASPEPPMSRPIGLLGGTLTVGEVSVTIPAGALDHDVVVSMTPIVAPLPGAVGQVYEIGPTGTQFQLPVSIAFTYTDGELAGRPASSFAVSTVAGKAWQAISTPAVDTHGLKISGTTTHLSPYALVAQAETMPDGGTLPESGADSAADDAGSGADASGADGTVAVGDAGGTDGSDGDGGCGSAPVSFSASVMPIFQQSCTLTSVCHGQMGNSGEENLYLGANAGGTSPAAIHDLLVGVRSKEDPSMNLVTAGDTSSSYLWHKVFGDQNSNPSVASGCRTAVSPCEDCTTNAPCGASEPYLSAPLAAFEQCAIQGWITQGAQNN